MIYYASGGLSQNLKVVLSDMLRVELTPVIGCGT